VHDAVALGNAAAARTVKPDRMHLVEIGHCSELVGDIAEFADRRDVAVHRIDRLEANKLRSVGGHAVETSREVGRVVAAEDMLTACRYGT
jgi:hypothetical protein